MIFVKGGRPKNFNQRQGYFGSLTLSIHEGIEITKKSLETLYINRRANFVKEKSEVLGASKRPVYQHQRKDEGYIQEIQNKDSVGKQRLS